MDDDDGDVADGCAYARMSSYEMSLSSVLIPLLVLCTHPPTTGAMIWFWRMANASWQPRFLRPRTLAKAARSERLSQDESPVVTTHIHTHTHTHTRTYIYIQIVRHGNVTFAGVNIAAKAA